MSNSEDKKKNPEWLEKLNSFYIKLNVCQKNYLNAIIFFGLMLMWCILFGFNNSKYLLLIFIFFWSTAIIYDFVSIYNKIYSSLLGKAFLLLCFSLCTNFSVAISGLVINDITGVAPTNFPHTMVLLSIAIIPFLTILVMGVIYLILILSAPLLLMYYFIFDDDFKKIIMPGFVIANKIFLYKTTRAIQTVSFACYFGFLYGFSHLIINDYNQFITTQTTKFIYTFEMYSKSPCQINSDMKIAFIGDGNVLTAKKENSRTYFKVMECNAFGK